MALDRELTAQLELHCPECARQDLLTRIGSRRGSCRSCNRFAQAVNRRLAKALTAAHPDEVHQLRPTIERDLYRSTVREGSAG